MNVAIFTHTQREGRTWLEVFKIWVMMRFIIQRDILGELWWRVLISLIKYLISINNKVMRELIDVLFWYSGCGFWSALTCFLLYRLHHLLIDKEIKFYIHIKNLIEFPFVMFYLRCWGYDSLEKSHKNMKEIKEDENFKMEDVYYLTKIGFRYLEYRYQRKKLKR
jgi:hypothetical protein